MKNELFFLFLFQIVFASCKKNDILPTFQQQISSEVLYGASGTTSGMKYGKMTDIDGNVYKTIQIGKQIWMAENLRVSKYRNGEKILNIINPNEWLYTSFGAWCYYNNNILVNFNYGKLYNWYSVNDNRNIAPKGWHIPSIEEVAILINYLGGSSVAGGKMKETGTTYWYSTSAEVSNSSGFSARAGGYRQSFNCEFYDLNYWGRFWTRSPENETNSYLYALDHASLNCEFSVATKNTAISVRCIKD